MVRIAEALLEREVLDGNEVRKLIAGTALTPLANTPPRNSDDSRGQVITPDGPMRIPPLEGGTPLPA